MTCSFVCTCTTALVLVTDAVLIFHTNVHVCDPSPAQVSARVHREPGDIRAVRDSDEDILAMRGPEDTASVDLDAGPAGDWEDVVCPGVPRSILNVSVREQRHRLPVLLRVL